MSVRFATLSRPPPRTSVGSSATAKLISLSRTPGKICGGGICAPNSSRPPALRKPPLQKAMPFWLGGGLSTKPASLPVVPRKTLAVAFHQRRGQLLAASPPWL
jgi:hypothetical protein